MEELLTRPLRVRVGPDSLEADLSLPPQARGLVVFAHGSGGTRRSPRDREVAQALQELSLGTLLFDLLTPDEAHEPSLLSDIDLLSRRLLETIEWIERRPALASLPLGMFGAHTGAAAALVAAARRPERVAAVVSRGGRPDLAAGALRQVKAPTLLIVGGDDNEGLEINRAASKLLQGVCSLKLVPRATHLFDEPGAMQRVTDLAAQWFTDHLASAAVKRVRHA